MKINNSEADNKNEIKNNIEYFDISDDVSDSDSRVKGSIKDRLISFLYRERFKIKLMSNKPLITSQRKISIFTKKRSIKKEISVIKDIRDLKKLGKKVIDVDPKTEKFDFDKYDYYVIEPVMKKGIDTEEIKAIKETRKKIQEAKSIVTNINKNVKKISINLEYPKEHRENLDKLVIETKRNVDLLKNKLSLIPNSKIDNSKLNNIVLKEDKIILEEAQEVIKDYEAKLNKYEENLIVQEAINEINFKKNIGISKDKKEIQVNKKEINEEDKLNNVNKNKTNNNLKVLDPSKAKLKSKKLALKKRKKVLNAFDVMKIEQIKNTDDKLKKDIDTTKEIVDKMNKEVNKVTKEISEVVRVTGYMNVLKSCLKVATGILTLPFNGVNLFNITLGSALVNKGLHGLRKGLVTKKEVKVNYNYEDLTEKIKKTKDKAKLTELLIVDSLNQISYMKQEVSYLNNEALDMLMKLESSLEKKLNEIKSIDKKLDKQDKQNKIKIKKVERQEY